MSPAAKPQVCKSTSHKIKVCKVNLAHVHENCVGRIEGNNDNTCTRINIAVASAISGTNGQIKTNVGYDTTKLQTNQLDNPLILSHETYSLQTETNLF